MARRKKVAIGTWVKVTWHDACDEKTTWMRAHEIDEAFVEVKSSGVVVRSTARYLTLAADVSGTSDDPIYGRVTRVPTGMIIAVVEDGL